MKVSIITATYNSQDSIISAIESVNHQTYPHIEHVFVDGNSSDNTLQKIETTSNRIKVIISEKDDGIYDALNKGLNIATGDVIGFVHSDDVLASSTIIEEIVNVFNSSKADGVYGDLLYVHKDNLNKIIRYWKGAKFRGNLIYRGWMPAHPTLFLKKEVYRKHGNFNTDYSIAADYDFILRIFTKKELIYQYLPNVVSKMRLGGASNQSLRNILLKSKEDIRALIDNQIPNPYWVILRKNISKLSQFLSVKKQGLIDKS